MRIWHMTADAGRAPLRVAPGRPVRLTIGTSPVAPDQAVTVTYDVIHPDGRVERGYAGASWERNVRDASYWSAVIGPFRRGDRVTYRIRGSQAAEQVSLAPVGFVVGPRLYVAILWHQHQPSYVDLGRPGGNLLQPWVRLHAVRAYYAMAALHPEFPDVHVTYNLTPVLLAQISRYVEGKGSDWLLDLAHRPIQGLTSDERERLLSACFDVDWQQLSPFPRYVELHKRRRQALPFSEQDVRDLLMWHNLSWFAPEFQRGSVLLTTGEEVSVQRFIEQARDFSQADIDEMLGEQYKIMAAIVPLYRSLQERGLIEVSTSPYYHPILPLLYDTDQATIDRPGACLPSRFHYPADAEVQVAKAVEDYRRRFASAPRGMWPAEGAISAETIPIYVHHGLEWIASDQGVLERSGRYGYEAGRADVLCRPYRTEVEGRSLSIFFRHTGLSNLISFYYHRAFRDMDLAAQDFVRRLHHDIADRLSGQEDRIVSIILDGENTYRAYGQQAPAFLRALYRRLGESPDLQTVTFSEYLRGNPQRRISPHPGDGQERIYELYTGSWIDEAGSGSGVDLGAWVGEPDENRAWDLLGMARAALLEAGVTPTSHPAAYEALYMAEGSDWFWWLGRDHVPERDAEYEVIFRRHLQNAYRLAGLEPPPALERPLVPWSLEWTLVEPLGGVGPGERLIVHANCPGTVVYRALPAGEQQELVMQPVSQEAGLTQCYEASLGPFGAEVHEVRLSFRCQQAPAQGGACVRVQRQATAIPEQPTAMPP